MRRFYLPPTSNGPGRGRQLVLGGSRHMERQHPVAARPSVPPQSCITRRIVHELVTSLEEIILKVLQGRHTNDLKVELHVAHHGLESHLLTILVNLKITDTTHRGGIPAPVLRSSEESPPLPLSNIQLASVSLQDLVEERFTRRSVVALQPGFREGYGHPF